MMKYVVMGTVVILIGLLLAEPAMQLGKRIGKRFGMIADDISEEEDED